jgi:hypothetical protein
MAPTTAQPQPNQSPGWLEGLKNLIGGLIQQASSKMGGSPPGPSGTPTGIPNLPAGLQARNSGNLILQHLSGLLGGGDPSKDQNSAYVMGQVHQQQAQAAAAKAKAVADGIKAHNNSLKKSMKAIPSPQQGTPGTGQTAPTSIQQLVQGAQANQQSTGQPGTIAGQ